MLMDEPGKLGSYGESDYQAAPQAVQDNTKRPSPLKPRRNNKRPILIALLVVVLAIAIGAYFLFKPHKAVPATKSSNTVSISTQPAPQVTATNASAEQYVSNGKDLNLSFTYPANWTITPPTNSNPNDQAITVTSPSISIQAADGTSATGKVVVNIRPGAATISELNANNPVAAQDSAQIAYSQPTASQHQYPYLTFIHFSNGLTTASAFEEVMITGVQAFTKGAALSAGSLGDLDPIISASFYHCSSTACSETTPGLLSITNSEWQNTTVFRQVQALFQSLKLN